MTQVRISPKDFFVWLGAIAALYATVAAVITLYLNYIDILLPDALDPRYADPYSGAVRFAMATLVVACPLFLYLMRYAHREARLAEVRQEVGIRKWLVYLTIFAAGALVAGDLIALVNTFLSGDITSRFLLKVLVILLVAGAVLWYFLEELKGRWLTDETLSVRIGIACGVCALATVVGGILLIGTPQDARAFRLDQERVNHLMQLENSILYSHFAAKQELPASLEDLRAQVDAYVPTDPATGAPYEYRVTGTTTFELCATFARASREREVADPSYTRPAGLAPENWAHAEGRHCFTRSFDPAFYPPVGKGPLPAEVVR